MQKSEMLAHIVPGRSISLKHQIKCRLKTGSDGILQLQFFATIGIFGS